MVGRTTALLAALMLPSVASALEYRILTLNDGRVMTVELTDTLAAGLQITVPQGQSEVPFTLLIDMVPSDPTEYLSQDDWVIYVTGPEQHEERLKAAFTAIPGIRVHGEEGVTSPITEDQELFANECGADVECLVAAFAEAPWTWIVVAKELDDSGSIELEGRLSSGPTHFDSVYNADQVPMLQQATYRAIGLRPSGDLPELEGPLWAEGGSSKPEKPSVPAGAVVPDSIAAASFVPIPGFPSLKNGDGKGFGMAMATVLPSTVVWVGISGKSTTNAGQWALMSVGGFYAMTVVANQAIALRPGAPAAGDLVVLPMVDPIEGTSGAQVSIRLK